ncbi:MAG: 30S ribosomal protein S6 [Elusimicrobiota bacterium]|jgi:small subunit ribosomal protein S6|nr:30S ribosomal protein S6 [Elusimicrobiota bacterium]
MNYECTFICSPDLPVKQVEELAEKVKKIIENAKGNVKTVQQLGKRKLAYPINKCREGSYVYMEISGDGAMINVVENSFRLNDDVIRYLTVKVEKKKVKNKPAAVAAPDEAVTPTAPAADTVEVKNNEPTTEQQSPSA